MSPVMAAQILMINTPKAAISLMRLARGSRFKLI